MLNTFKSEIYKLPNKIILIYLILSIISSTILAVGVLFYNVYNANLVITANKFYIYHIAMFTPFIFLTYGMVLTYIISIEYDSNMWSIILINNTNRIVVISTKYIISLMIIFLQISMFFFIHILVNFIITHSILELDKALFILLKLTLGCLGMLSILFLLSILVENKVYMITISAITALATALVQDSFYPFKYPEYIINTSSILFTNKMSYLDSNAIAYGGYSMGIFFFFSLFSYIIFTRKDI